MKSADIRMEEQYFTALNISVKNDVDLGSERFRVTPAMMSGLEMRSHITCASPAVEDAHQFAVTMEIALDDGELNKKFPYFILVRSVAIFNVKQGAFSDFESRRDGVLNIAVPHMYAGIADVVASHTARSWAGLAHLPMMNFDARMSEAEPTSEEADHT